MKGMDEWVASTVMEADDLMCIYQTMYSENSIICSRDKDLKQCPCWHYGWEIGRQAQFGPELVDKQGWIKLDKSGNTPRIKGTGLSFFYAQCLTGDAVDNIPGIPQCGPVKAWSNLTCKTLLGGTEGNCLLLDNICEGYRINEGEEWQNNRHKPGRRWWVRGGY